jgi:ubiquinone/menaquinone biosynthesis C-methylase UbiE
MTTPDDARRRARETYDAAADAYDDPANSFWGRFGARTIERLELGRGARVLDVCCGSGASALPAARAVGESGAVLGVDLAANLLALARAKASAHGHGNVEFRSGDLLALGLEEESFDAVVCVFGIFFVPDMPAAVRALWRLVRPGGRLALTTWGPRLFEPVNSFFWQAVRERRPELHKSFQPWDRITEPDTVRALLAEGGVPPAQIDAVAEPGEHALRSSEDAWKLVLGSGYRGTLEQLSAADRAHVQHACEAAMRAREVRSVEANVIYAVARK